MLKKNKFININHLSSLAAISMLGVGATSGVCDGIYRNGVGARAMALGGADVAYAVDPLGSMAANPAGLGFLSDSELDLSLNGASASGHFDKSGSGGQLDNKIGLFPDAAFAIPIAKSGFTVGLSVINDAALDSDWRYQDPTEAGQSYGNQRDRSEIILYRGALGVGYEISPQWSVGASLGLEYNENRLQAPYIFQNPSPSALKGAKVLLDMTTTGWGYNAQAGVLFRPTEKWEFGASYTSPTTIFSQGDAAGDASQAIHSATPVPYRYDAQVKNVLPQVATAGASWKFLDQWRAIVQLDWINWGDAFTSLPVSLHNSASTLGVPVINDSIPLNWKNEFVYRGGLEYNVTTNIVLRGGYSFGESPVPNGTLSPLTAVIPEHTLTFGAGYHWSRYSVDAAYQWELPATRSIGTSDLGNGEYSNSSITVSIQTVTLSAGIKF